MTKTIICTIDFSESSKDALRWSVSLARLLKTNLMILYTYRLLTSPDAEAVDLRKTIEESAFRIFSSLEKEILTESGISYDFKVEVGLVSSRVIHHAKTNEVSFLVMGSKMNSSSKQSFDELVESIQVPLVIVPLNRKIA